MNARANIDRSAFIDTVVRIVIDSWVNGYDSLPYERIALAMGMSMADFRSELDRYNCPEELRYTMADCVRKNGSTIRVDAFMVSPYGVREEIKRLRQTIATILPEASFVS